jgi:hypothetical protein
VAVVVLQVVRNGAAFEDPIVELLLTNVGESQGNYDELRFFTGLGPSEEIALVVTDYDAAHGRAECDQSARPRHRQRLYEDR